MIRKLRQKKARNEKGFTLIELMIVIAIIGILAAIAIPNFLSYREKGYVASMKSDCNSVRVAEEAYLVDNGTYLAFVVATAPPAGLVGVKNFSDGNSVVVDLVGTTGFKVTVTSTKLTAAAANVVYDSATGATVYTP